MKRPKPRPATNAPPGTVWFGGPIPWFAITLSLHGDALDPHEVTRLLRTTPTDVEVIGQPVCRADGSLKRVGRRNRWSARLRASDTHEWDVAEAIRLMLQRFPGAPEVWDRIPEGVTRRLLVSGTLAAANQGLSIDPEILTWLGERQIRFDLDVYRDDFEL